MDVFAYLPRMFFLRGGVPGVPQTRVRTVSRANINNTPVRNFISKQAS